jgi:hypothetical protein
MAGDQHITRVHPSTLRRLLFATSLHLEDFGSIYGLSPLLAFCSTRWARRQLSRELARSSLGMILVVVCVKP